MKHISGIFISFIRICLAQLWDCRLKAAQTEQKRNKYSRYDSTDP